MRDLRLDVKNALNDPGQPFPFQMESELPPMEVLDETVRFQPIEITGTVTGSDEAVSVEATISATVKTRCSRCLTDVAVPIRTEVREAFTASEQNSEEDAYPLSGTVADLEPMVRDALLLELPIKILCREECPGLCPVCGVDLNQSDCLCQRDVEDKNPFSALRELLIDDEEV